MFVLVWAVVTELSWPKLLKTPSMCILTPLIFNFNLENSIRKFQDNLEVFTVNRLHKLVMYIYYVSY